MNSVLQVIAGSIGIFAFALYWLLSGPSNLPPGPHESAILGNALPGRLPWLVYAKWMKQYGDIIHLRVLGQHFIVLGSSLATKELLEDKSAIYSDRPRFPMIAELMGWDWAVQFMSYGPKFHRYRKPIVQSLSTQTIGSYYPVITRETHRLLLHLLNDPDRFLHHIQRAAASIMMSLLYGYSDGPVRDSYIASAELATESLVTAGNVGGYVVDLFPILKYYPEWLIPGGGFKRQAREWRTLCMNMIDVPFADVKRRMANGSALPSLTTTLLEQLPSEQQTADEEHIIKSTAGVIHLGGADTQLSALYSFMLAMAQYPDVQAKAQQEIDSIVGADRLPDFSDRSSLPYMECLLSEVYRWNPVVPLGVPHRVMSDDVYRGYHIPAGSIILPNVWAILHDENTYRDPLEFKPERYQTKGDNHAERDPRSACFGFGRRLCPGRHFADATLWFICVSILATFDIGKPFDEAGAEMRSPGEYTTGLSTCAVFV